MLGCDDPRLHNVRLSTSQGTADRFIGGNHTYAWGVDQLQPAVGPAGGGIAFTAGHPAAQFLLSPRQQELMAFDGAWNLGPEGFLQASRPIDLSTGDFTAYNTILGHGAMQLQGPPGYGNFRAAHLVRYWHGACSIRLNWTVGDLALFPLIDEGLGRAFACSARYPVEKDPQCATNSETYFPCPLVKNTTPGVSMTSAIDTAQ